MRRLLGLVDLLLEEAEVADAHLLGGRPPDDDLALGAALVAEALATAATVVLLLEQVNELLVAAVTRHDLRVGHPVGGRHLVGHPLFGEHGRLGAHALYGLADVGDVVDDLARQVVRRADVVLLAVPDVLELGAHHRLRVRIAVPVLTRTIDDAVMRTLEHIT